LARVVAREGRLDDELFVTAWMWEEGKHADFFARYLHEVVGAMPAPAGPRLFEVELSGSMNALLTDSTPAALARALSTYCLIVEGVLFDTGQGALEDALTARGLLPGLLTALVLVNRDESRHVAYGLHALRRLIARDPSVTGVVVERARELAPLVTALADDVIVRFGSRPFELSYTAREPEQRLRGLLERLAGDEEPALP
jgi:ribonucleoside-diphosphate reductase beta chain